MPTASSSCPSSVFTFTPKLIVDHHAQQEEGICCCTYMKAKQPNLGMMGMLPPLKKVNRLSTPAGGLAGRVLGRLRATDKGGGGEGGDVEGAAAARAAAARAARGVEARARAAATGEAARAAGAVNLPFKNPRPDRDRVEIMHVP